MAVVRVLVGMGTAVDDGVVLVVTAAGDSGGCDGGGGRQRAMFVVVVTAVDDWGGSGGGSGDDVFLVAAVAAAVSVSIGVRYDVWALDRPQGWKKRGCKWRRTCVFEWVVWIGIEFSRDWAFVV